MTSTQLSSSVQTGKRAVWAAFAALAAIGLFVLVIAALHFLRPDHNPLQLPMSEYAVGPHGWLMTLAFVFLGMAWFALARGVAQSAHSRVGLGFLRLWAAGVLIAMMFPMDAPGAPKTVVGAIHDVTGPVAFLSLTVGMILVSRRFRLDAGWRPFYRVALALSLAMPVAYAATLVSFIAGLPYLGLCQRIMIATSVIWFVYTAAHLRAVQR